MEWVVEWQSVFDLETSYELLYITSRFSNWNRLCYTQNLVRVVVRKFRSWNWRANSNFDNTQIDFEQLKPVNEVAEHYRPMTQTSNRIIQMLTHTFNVPHVNQFFVLYAEQVNFAILVFECVNVIRDNTPETQ